MNRFWHKEHFKCFKCKRNLGTEEGFNFEGGRLYCTGEGRDRTMHNPHAMPPWRYCITSQHLWYVCCLRGVQCAVTVVLGVSEPSGSGLSLCVVHVTLVCLLCVYLLSQRVHLNLHHTYCRCTLRMRVTRLHSSTEILYLLLLVAVCCWNDVWHSAQSPLSGQSDCV